MPVDCLTMWLSMIRVQHKVLTTLPCVSCAVLTQSAADSTQVLAFFVGSHGGQAREASAIWATQLFRLVPVQGCPEWCCLMTEICLLGHLKLKLHVIGRHTAYYVSLCVIYNLDCIITMYFCFCCLVHGHSCCVACNSRTSSLDTLHMLLAD